MTERGERATGVRDGWAGRARPAGQAQAAADASPPPATPRRTTHGAPRRPRRAGAAWRAAAASTKGAARPRRNPARRSRCVRGRRSRTPTRRRSRRAGSQWGCPVRAGRLVIWRPARGKAGTDTRPRARDGCAPGPRRVLRPSHGWRRPPPPRPRRPAAHGLAASTCCIRGVARSHGRGRGAVGDAYTPPGGRRPRRGWRRRVGRGVRV